eukprot:Selendium_serpulae@DN6084_c2_g1_i5.p1
MDPNAIMNPLLIERVESAVEQLTQGTTVGLHQAREIYNIVYDELIHNPKLDGELRTYFGGVYEEYLHNNVIRPSQETTDGRELLVVFNLAMKKFERLESLLEMSGRFKAERFRHVQDQGEIPLPHSMLSVKNAIELREPDSPSQFDKVVEAMKNEMNRQRDMNEGVVGLTDVRWVPAGPTEWDGRWVSGSSD